MCPPVKLTHHARSRRKERDISRDSICSIEEIKQFPIYGTDNGCTKYLDMESLIVYYVRGNRIVTMISTNQIQMLRYYVFGIQTGKIKVECGKLCKARCKCLDFNNYCRDHSFKNCKRGSQCKYIHVN